MPEERISPAVAIIAVGLGLAGLVGIAALAYAKAAPPGLIGDLNDDGTVDYDDLAILESYIAGYPIPEISPLSEAEFLRRADVNGDGMINALDISALEALIVAPPVPDIPEGFTISNLTITPEITAVGYPITISVIATDMTGIANPPYDFYFHIDGEVLKVTYVYPWGIGIAREVSISYTPTEVRTYGVKIANLEGSFIATELPEVMLSPLPMESLSPVSTSPGGRIRISDLTIEPSVVHIGGSVTISVEVANHYAGGAGWGIDCTVNHIVVRQSGGLGAGARVLVSWQATPYIAKTFSVDIDGEWSGLIGSFEAIL